MSNRTIGIISHADVLKQRISALIRVEKGSNGYGPRYERAISSASTRTTSKTNG